MNASPFNLDRFVTAQEPVIATVLNELRRGRKGSHWIWFIFPQIAGLGSSRMAQRFAITSLDEAKAYASHPVLGTRLIQGCTSMMAATGSATDILGSPDDLKFRSCLTLFNQAAPQEAIFQQALDRFFNGEPDQRTLDILGKTL